jgi:hypothetical protein
MLVLSGGTGAACYPIYRSYGFFAMNRQLWKFAIGALTDASL